VPHQPVVVGAVCCDGLREHFEQLSSVRSLRVYPVELELVLVWKPRITRGLERVVDGRGEREVEPRSQSTRRLRNGLRVFQR
jgi:hypothetical protein